MEGEGNASCTQQGCSSRATTTMLQSMASEEKMARACGVADPNVGLDVGEFTGVEWGSRYDTLVAKWRVFLMTSCAMHCCFG